MAKKNGRDDPPKPQVTENGQMSDIVFILDKMEDVYKSQPHYAVTHRGSGPGSRCRRPACPG